MGITNTVQVALLGFGNVGTGVAQILEQNRELIERRTGKIIRIAAVVVRDPSRYHDRIPVGVRVTSDANDVIQDPDIDVIVEVMGGEFPAFDYISAALKAGKYVVTANKEVVSKHKKTFFDLALQYGANLYYEAAVGGGIPLIRTLKVGLAANKIQSIYGIVNGTTNYILTQLGEGKKPFSEVVADAQRLGFAEADPTMDVSGLDSAYKLSILASVAFKADVAVSDIPYEGITSITLDDMSAAHELGYTIRLLAIGQAIGEGQLSFCVHPTLVPLNHPLAGVRNEFNAVYIVGNAVGESLLSGRGAGSSPTGSAIVSDLIDIAFDDQPQSSARNLDYAFDRVQLVPISDTESEFFLRVRITDAPGAMAAVASVFSSYGISMAKVVQKGATDGAADLIVLTHRVVERQLDAALAALVQSPVVLDCLAKIHAGVA